MKFDPGSESAIASATIEIKITKMEKVYIMVEGNCTGKRKPGNYVKKSYIFF